MKPMAKVDLEQVMGIEASFEKFAWKEASFMKYVDRVDRRDAFVVNDADDVVVGYVLLKECECGRISIVKMAVAGNRRNQGLGTFILGWTRAHAQGKGAKGLILHVRGSNPKALNLYARTGFKVTEMEQSGYKDKKATGAEQSKIAMQLIYAEEGSGRLAGPGGSSNRSRCRSCNFM
jgi:ribosomal protein S18 acetylase RimI-like enzyme